MPGRRTGDLGNFWVDLVRTVLRILLPISVIAAIVLIAGGAIQNFHLHDQVVTTLNGAQQTITGGPVASQEAIKELGTNGGGFYNANSSHPFENPTVWTNWLEIFLLLVISFSLPRTFGRMVGSTKQGYAIASVMASLYAISVSCMLWFQLQHHGTVPTAVGAAMEGVEQRFGVANSAVFADSTTLTSTGAVDSFHDSYTSLGGMITLFNMQLGEVAPGGTGSGLYGMLVLAVITVFVAGLMVGRTPEYLGKKINPREIKLAASYFLVTPLIVLIGTAIAMALPANAPACSTPARTGCRRCCTRSPPRPTTTGPHSPESASTRTGTTPRSGWPWCSAGSCRWCWCSRWPARWPSRATRRNRRAHCPPIGHSSSEWSPASR